MRSKIIIDVNGTRTTCSSIKEFEAAAAMLSPQQRNYILNVAHQGLFGGGSTLKPAQLNSLNIFIQDTRNHTDNQGAMPLTADVPLCVSVQNGKVALTNTIDFPITKYNERGRTEPFSQDTSLTLSMIADITTLVKSEAKTNAEQRKEMPIYMTISHQNKPAEVEIINDFRKLESNAEVTGPTKTNITNFIQQLRDNKTHDNILYGQKVNFLIDIIEKLATKSLDNSKSLEERQTNLDNILGKNTFTIPDQSQPYEIAAKILSIRTSPDKDQIRLHYAAHAITKYAAGFDNQPGLKPSPEVVSKIVDTLIEDTKTKDILQKNAKLILRHATDNKDLGFKDRVKKVFDRISIFMSTDKQVAKSFAAKILEERKKTPRSAGR